MSKSLLEQAIAEAKDVRKTALENAKLALEEAITPKLQHMFSTKLSEELEEDEDLNENEDINLDEVEELDEVEAELDEAKDDDKKDSKPKSDSKPKKEKDDDKADDVEDVVDDEVEDVDSKDVKDLSVEELKDVIRDIVQTELAGEATPGDETMGDDTMDSADDLSMGSDEGAVDDTMSPTGSDIPDANVGVDVPSKDEDDDIDLDEVLAELEAINTAGDEIKEGAKQSVIKKTMNSKTGAPGFKKVGTLKEVDKLQTELNEAYKVINMQRKELKENNLLNAKLIYVNSIFKSKSLNESQKLKVIEKFDKATTVKEAKLVFETLMDGFKTKPSTKSLVRESLSFASKPAGVATKKPIVAVDETVKRFQELAGITKKQF